jgi:hypothetical protein
MHAEERIDSEKGNKKAAFKKQPQVQFPVLTLNHKRNCSKPSSSTTTTTTERKKEKPKLQN